MVYPLRTTVRWVPQIIERKLPYNPAIPFLDIYPIELKVGPQIFVFAHLWYLYTQVCSRITHSGENKETTQLSAKRWMDKQTVVCTYNDDEALKCKEIVTSITLYMDLNIMLSEISQSQENKYCMIPIMWGT